MQGMRSPKDLCIGAELTRLRAQIARRGENTGDGIAAILRHIALARFI
jgi:hypothetical protein